MSTTASPAPNRPKPPKVAPDRMAESPWHKAIPYVVFALIVCAVLILMTLIFGQVTGEEFCPNTFEQRRFHYFQIPILRTQVTGIQRKDMGLGMASTVEDHASNVDSAATVKNWDLVSSKRVSAQQWLGDAKILCDLLTIRGKKSGYLWQTWSENYPHLADRFWPVVADTAQAGSYILMPDLFELAQQAGFDSATSVEDEDTQDEESEEDDPDVAEVDELDDEDAEESKEDSSDEEDSDEENDASNSDGENDDQEEAAGNDDEENDEDGESESDEDAEKASKKKAKKKKQKKPLTPEQQAEAAAFESTLRSFMAKETVVLANQFENGGELIMARRAYELATKYSDDPAAQQNFDRLKELAPPIE